MAQWFSRMSFVDTLSSCNAHVFPRDPLRSSRRLKMSYRLTAVCLSAGGHHGFVAELPRIRERIPRGRNVTPTLSTPPCQTRSTPRSRSRARAFRFSKRERSYIDPSTWKRRNNMDLSSRRHRRRLFHTSDICQKYRARYNTNINKISLNWWM